jgi:hypothetical protein
MAHAYTRLIPHISYPRQATTAVAPFFDYVIEQHHIPLCHMQIAEKIALRLHGEKD